MSLNKSDASACSAALAIQGEPGANCKDSQVQPRPRRAPGQMTAHSAALPSATLPLPAGIYHRRVVRSPTFYLQRHAAPAEAAGSSVPPLDHDLDAWVQELLRTGEVAKAHTPWTTVVVQWTSDGNPEMLLQREYFCGGPVQWDLDFFPWAQTEARIAMCLSQTSHEIWPPRPNTVSKPTQRPGKMVSAHRHAPASGT